MPQHLGSLAARKQASAGLCILVVVVVTNSYWPPHSTISSLCRFALSPGAPGTQQASGDLSPPAQHVEQGETQDIQVLRITAAGRFFR